MGECSASKEVVIAVQEAIEHMESSFDEDEVDDEKNLSPSLPGQLITLVGLYASCECLIALMKLADAKDAALPRLRLRRKTASETIRPLLSELEGVIKLAGACCSRDEGRALTTSVSHLVRNVAGWMKTIVDVTDEEILACQVSATCSIYPSADFKNTS